MHKRIDGAHKSYSLPPVPKKDMRAMVQAAEQNAAVSQKTINWIGSWVSKQQFDLKKRKISPKKATSRIEKSITHISNNTLHNRTFQAIRYCK